MARINTSAVGIKTHEGASAARAHGIDQLRRSVMSCMLWESEFYEDGEKIADRIMRLSETLPADEVARVAIEARSKYNLRHVPLLIVRAMAKRKNMPGGLVADTLAEVIQRPDELAEFISIYWKDGKQPLSAQVKKGLARAFVKFGSYQLAKYNRDDAIKLRDVLFLVHAKPKDDEQAAVWKQLVDGTLAAPDTWEVALSGGGDKRETFERLMREKKLGGLAFLRNLRNMAQAGVSRDAVAAYAQVAKADRILPFRFVAAARHVPQWEHLIEPMMLRAAGSFDHMEGPTAILVDHSGSMRQMISEKSEISRFDAASALAILVRETCENVRVFTFSDRTIEVASRRGFALADGIKSVINPVGTRLGKAVRTVYANFPECRRVIVITDEQSSDAPPQPIGAGYIINVASFQNGVGHGKWVTINGWSDAVIQYINAIESEASYPDERYV